MIDPLQFALAAFLLLIVPGPTNTLMAVAGANAAARPWAYLGAMLAGYIAIIFAVRLIVLPLVASVALLGIVLKAAVVVYLLYAAWRLWRRGATIGEANAALSPMLVLTTTALNPKGLVFAVSILPAEHPQLWGYFAAFAALTLVAGSVWFFAGRLLGRLSKDRAALLPRAGALVLTGFAAWIAATIAG